MNANTEIKSTTCAYCGVGCGIKAEVNIDAHEVTIKGQNNHPANLGRLCSKGTALGNTIGLNERLLKPEINGQTVEWNTALDHVAKGFNETIEKYGPDAVAFYVSGQLLTEDYYVANKLMKGFIGSGNIDTNSRLCMSSSVVGHKRAFGTDTVPGCYEDFEQAELITLVGSNTAWCHPVLFQRIKAYKEANPNVKIVVVDPRRTQTCDIADLHLPINLGTDSWLFNGLLNALNNQNKINSDYLSQYCEGFESALNAAQLSSGDSQQLANTLGVDLDDLNQFYNWFCNTEKSVTLYSQGVNQSSSGTDKVNTILNCHLATGRIGKPGMGPFSMTGQPNAMGGREVGGLANTLAAHMDFNDDAVDRVQRFWDAPNMATRPGQMAVDMFNAIEQGKIKAVWIMATNPVVSLPNADQVKRALESCPLVVISDCIADTDTGRFAHVKLPATGWSEKDGTVTNSERRISRQRGLLPPAGEAKHDWWIIKEVAKRMGFESAFDYPDQASIFREHAALSGFENNEQGFLRDFDISALSNITAEEYEALTPFQWPLNTENPQGRERFFSQGQFFTPNRKGRLLAIEPKLPKNAPSDEYPLRLNTGRIRDQWHTMTRTALAPQLNQHISEPFVEINRATAKRLNLSDGSLVEVSSRWGAMLGRLNVNDNPKPDDLFAPMHWTATLTRKGRINPVVNPEVDPFSKQPESKHTPVKVEAYQAKWHGFILSRDSLSWPKSDYLVSVNGSAHTRLELAHNQDLENPLQDMLSWLGFETEADVTNKGFELLAYEDASSNFYRLAIMNPNGQLEAVAMVAPSESLPQRTWLALQFEKSSIDERSRQALLSGFAPAGEDVGAIICACFSVGSKTIEKAVKGGCKTAAAVGDQLKAGTNCGSCIPEIKSIIASTPNS
jgi:assimilatory nitrate reductase catalytic subunit